jgi:hypothetical protein
MPPTVKCCSLIGCVAQGDLLVKSERCPAFRANAMVVVGPHAVARQLGFCKVPPFKGGGMGVVVFLIFPLVSFQLLPPVLFSPIFQSPLPFPFSTPVVPEEEEE